MELGGLPWTIGVRGFASHGDRTVPASSTHPLPRKPDFAMDTVAKTGNLQTGGPDRSCNGMRLQASTRIEAPS
jgi:hypothetical protein